MMTKEDVGNCLFTHNFVKLRVLFIPTFWLVFPRHSMSIWAIPDQNTMRHPSHAEIYATRDTENMNNFVGGRKPFESYHNHNPRPDDVKGGVGKISHARNFLNLRVLFFVALKSAFLAKFSNVFSGWVKACIIDFEGGKEKRAKKKPSLGGKVTLIFGRKDKIQDIQVFF